MNTLKWLVLDGSGVLQPSGRAEIALEAEALQVLREVVVAHPDLRLALSSTWRRDHALLARVMRQMAAVGLELHDATPVGRDRPWEIATFLAEEARRTARREGLPLAVHAVVLEDEEPMAGLEPITVRTNPARGIVAQDLPRILEVLQTPLFVLGVEEVQSGSVVSLPPPALPRLDLDPVLTSMVIGGGPNLMASPPVTRPADTSKVSVALIERLTSSPPRPSDRAQVLQRRRERRGRRS